MPKVIKHLPSWTDMFSTVELVEPFAPIFPANDLPLRLTTVLAKAGDLDARKILRVIRKEQLRPDYQQVDNLVLDDYIQEARVDAGKFKERLFHTLATFAKQKAEGMVSANLPQLVQTSIELAGQTGDDKNSVLIKHLEAQGFFNAPRGSSVNVNVNATAQAGAQSRSMGTFEETLTEFERAEERFMQAKQVKALPPAQPVDMPVESREKETV